MLSYLTTRTLTNITQVVPSSDISGCSIVRCILLFLHSFFVKTKRIVVIIIINCALTTVTLDI